MNSLINGILNPIGVRRVDDSSIAEKLTIASKLNFFVNGIESITELSLTLYSSLKNPQIFVIDFEINILNNHFDQSFTIIPLIMTTEDFSLIAMTETLRE